MAELDFSQEANPGRVARVTSLSARALGTLIQNWRTSGHRPRVCGARRPDPAARARRPARRSAPACPPNASSPPHLGLSRTTVSAAYADLRESGLPRQHARLGECRPPAVARSRRRCPTRSARPTSSTSARPPCPRCRRSRPRPSAPPHCCRRFLGESGFDPLGLRVLRQALADRYTARGLPTDADEIMITIGAQHAIGLLARTLLSRGDRALVETPSYPHAFEALRASGARLVPVPVTTDEGWDELALEQAFQRTSPDARLPHARLPQPDRSLDVARAARAHGRPRRAPGHHAGRRRDDGRAGPRRSGCPCPVRDRRPRRHRRVGRQDRLGRPADRLDPRRPRAHPARVPRAVRARPRHPDPRAAHPARAAARVRPHPRGPSRLPARRPRPPRRPPRRAPSRSGRCRTPRAA